MTERYFIDTNVLVYADDLDAGDKNVIARELLREAITTGAGVLSTQVLQEFFVVSTRKLGVPPEIARRKIELLATLHVVRIDVPIILSAIDLHRRRSLSFWDSLIVRCAVEAKCARVLTEDLQHDQEIDGVRVVNPFIAP